MRKFAWCPALLVMSVLTTQADGRGLWDRFKASLPTVAGEPSFVELPDVSGAQYIGDAEYVDGESSVVIMPDGMGYPDAHYDYDSCGCTQCKGYISPCTKCFRYLRSMWSRVSRKRHDCCGVDTYSAG